MKYLIIYEDYSLNAVEEITTDDINACLNGYVSIVRLEDITEMNSNAKWDPIIKREEA